ncbi:MAG: hypothetical protein PGN08_05220 [Sphingomonas taxi]
MIARDARPSFAARPRDPEAWVREPEPKASAAPKSNLYTARLTVDVTPDLRGRLKIAAFRRGLTLADMLRALLEEAFPADGSERP